MTHSYPGCCPTSWPGCPFPMYSTIQLNLRPECWGWGRNNTLPAVCSSLPPLDLKVTSVIPAALIPAWGQGRWTEFTHPLNQRNPDPSKGQISWQREGISVGLGSWVWIISSSGSVLLQGLCQWKARWPRAAEPGPADTRLYLPCTGRWGPDRWETGTWQSCSHALREMVCLGSLFLAPLCFVFINFFKRFLLTWERKRGRLSGG